MDQQPDSWTVQSNSGSDWEIIKQQTEHAELSPGSGCPNHDTFSSQEHYKVLEHGYYIKTLHDFANYVKLKGVDKVLDDMAILGYKADMT